MTLTAASVSVPLVIAVLAVVFSLAARRWRAVSSRFPQAGAAPAGTASFENGSAFGMQFRGLLSVGGSAAGLYVAPSFPPLRWLFPAMCVPWPLVFPDGEYRAMFLICRFRLGTPDGPSLEIFKAGRPYRAIAPYLPSAGTAPPVG